MAEDKTMTQNSISISSVLQGNGGSTSSYVEQIITLKIINIIEKMFKKFNKKYVLMLIILLCANEGKQFVLQLLTSSKTELYKLIITLYYKYSKPKLLQNECSRKEKTGLTLKFNSNLLFWKNIHKVMVQEKDLVSSQQKITYNYTYDNFEYKSKNEYSFVKTFNDLIIKTDLFTCSFKSNIDFTISSINNVQNVVDVSVSPDSCKLEKGQTFFDVFPFDDFKTEVTKEIDYGISSGRFDSCDNVVNQCKLGSNAIFTNIFKSFDEQYNFVDKIRSFYELRSIMECINSGLTAITIFNHKFRHNSGFTMSKLFLPSEFYKKYDCIKTWFEKIQNNSSENNNCMIFLEPRVPDVNLFDEWSKYIESINDYEYDDIKQVNVYDIHIKIEEIAIQDKSSTNTNDNDSDKGDKKIDTNTLLLLNYMNSSKNEPATKIVKNIHCELMNQVYKSFDTLYLQKQDEFILKSTLTRFKDKRELFKTLGIPYKLGVLLHGEPGCGKSSVITAIASYLKRDIFYLDLSNVSTNEDLKLLFKYINTQQNKNGIIVMEDIDTMCKIVLKRTETNNGISDNGQLTLDCLLNLLQGTLTEDGLIFIATTNCLEKIDPAFYREGRFDVNINMKACDSYQMQCIYKKLFERPIPPEYIETLKDKTITPAKFINNLLPFVLLEKEDSEILKIFE